MNSDEKSPAKMTNQQQAYEDEISLVDIVRVLLSRKKLMFGITALVVCIGLIYAFSAKRVYQAETILLPPTFEDIQPLNVLGSNRINSAPVFNTFIRSIESRKIKKVIFFEFAETSDIKANSKDIYERFERFSKSLKVSKDKSTSTIRITLEGEQKEKIGFWLDSLVEMANKETINQLVKNLQSEIDLKIKNIKREILGKRSIYKQRHKDELARLQEAFQTAKDLEIREYNNARNMFSNKNNLSIYMNDQKLYMQGTKILQAEIKALKSRTSGDIYIEGLRDLEEKLTRLEAIKIEKKKLRATIIDKKAVVEVKPIRPNRKLIVIFSLLIGGLLGIFSVFIMGFIGKLKNKVDSIKHN